MPTYVAFLRAINLGPTRTFAKDAIRSATEDAGGSDVETYLNTGNVRLAHSARSVGKVQQALEKAYAEEAGFEIPTVVFTTALAAAGFRHLPRPERLRGKAATRLAVVATVVALALVVPNRANGWCVQAKLGKARNGPRIEPTHTVIRSSVRTIRGLGLRPPVRVLEVGSARAFYSGFGAGHVFPQTIPAGEGFLAFVQRADIGLIVLEPVMAECPQLRDDPDFRALMDGKESARFRLVPVEGYPFLRVAVRRDLMPAE